MAEQKNTTTRTVRKAAAKTNTSIKASEVDVSADANVQVAAPATAKPAKEAVQPNPFASRRVWPD